MSKNWKRQSSSQSVNNSSPRYPVQLPEVIDIDTLSVMLDEELIARTDNLDEAIRRTVASQLNPRPWEEELAYVKREQQIRRVRHSKHVEYMRHAEDDHSQNEWNLPAGDFDNSAFVYAATNGRPRWS